MLGPHFWWSGGRAPPGSAPARTIFSDNVAATCMINKQGAHCSASQSLTRLFVLQIYDISNQYTCENILLFCAHIVKQFVRPRTIKKTVSAIRWNLKARGLQYFPDNPAFQIFLQGVEKLRTETDGRLPITESLFCVITYQQFASHLQK